MQSSGFRVLRYHLCRAPGVKLQRYPARARCRDRKGGGYGCLGIRFRGTSLGEDAEREEGGYTDREGGG